MICEVINRHSYYRGMIGLVEDTAESIGFMWYRLDGVWFKQHELKEVDSEK
jgi:hypothetical protein